MEKKPTIHLPPTSDAGPMPWRLQIAAQIHAASYVNYSKGMAEEYALKLADKLIKAHFDTDREKPNDT